MKRDRTGRQTPAAIRDAGLAQLARRIASRTTDLIAIGVLLIAGLSIGRQVHEWWKAAPPDVAPRAAEGVMPDFWGNPERSVEMEFGDAPLSLTRQVVPGDREKALGRLVEVCRAIVADSRLPRLAADEAEATLVARTSGLKPSAEKPGVWQVYRLDDRFSMVVGLRNGNSHEGGPQSGDAGATPRLICWGMALPLGTGQWSLYTFTSLGAARGSGGPIPEIELPPGARRSLGLRSATGAITGFSGRGSADAWRNFFVENLRSQGWRSPDGWLVSGRTSSIQFTSTTAGTGGEITIQFATDDAGGMTGLINSVLPQGQSRKESDE